MDDLKQIPWAKNYAVSCEGKIWSYRNRKFLSDKNNAMSITADNGSCVQISVSLGKKFYEDLNLYRPRQMESNSFYGSSHFYESYERKLHQELMNQTYQQNVSRTLAAQWIEAKYNEDF